ncbi:hypothetical protein BVX97_05220 [bacterium E08(2017)]|nr:hypothetical protein BVX97_05220 [bacterium E08(2017)]
MKKNNITFACLFLTVILTPILSFAIGPVSGSNDAYEYLFGGSDLSKVSAGFYTKQRVVEVSAAGMSGIKTPYEMTLKKTGGYVGYDIARWATLYGTVAMTDTKLSVASFDYPGFFEEFNGGDNEIGIGIAMNLLDHDIADPTLAEDKIRINAILEYTKSESDWLYANDVIRWDELYGSLVFSLVNEIHGAKNMWVHAIAFYAGPCFSQIRSSSIDHDGDYGYVGGFTVYFSQTLSFDVGYERLAEGGYSFGANVRF